jgi:topoisomerase IV subunit A
MAKIRDVQLTKYSVEMYSKYALYSTEMRATPDYRDGLQSIHRRILWSMHELGLKSTVEKAIKSARVVGDTIGKYHPHGDQAAYGAMVNIAGGKHHSNICEKLVEGTGNWGSLSDGGMAASQRYTEAKLSAFSDRVIFDPFYVPATHMVPNFDGSGLEPEVLPVLLPVLILNGQFGIAPGVQCSVPCFTRDSVKSLLASVYSGSVVDGALCLKHLVLRTTHGGRAAKTAENRTALRDLTRSSVSGRIVFESKMVVDPSTKTATLTRFAVDNIERPIAKLAATTGIAYASDDSGKGDQFATVVVKFSKTASVSEVARLSKLVAEAFSTASTFRLNLSHRKFNPSTGDVDISLLSPSLPALIEKWVEWRTELEVRACKHWIQVAARQLAQQNVLLCAVRNREIIIRSLDRVEPMNELIAWLAQKLKITVEAAAAIYELKVRQLRALEEAGILEAIEVIEKRSALLTHRMNNPKPEMLKQLENL